MTNNYSLSVGSWFSRGWETFNRNRCQLIAASLICTVCDLLYYFPSSNTPIIVIQVVGAVLMSVILVGWYYMCLKSVKGEKTAVVDVFSGFSRLGSVLALCIILAVMLTGGVVLLIIPGIILALMYGLSVFAIMDKKATVKESLRLSGRITKGYKGKLFCLFLVMGILWSPQLVFGPDSIHEGGYSTLTLVGVVLLFLIDAIVVAPWTSSSMAVAYDDLVQKYEDAS